VANTLHIKIPAMNFLLQKNENGPLNLSLWQLVIWSLGVCYFGVVFAVPLYVARTFLTKAHQCRVY
jgi:uncharacterized oligopeptide transporter (OPT) family protein